MKTYSICGNQFVNFATSFKVLVFECKLINFTFDNRTNTVIFSGNDNLKIFKKYFNTALKNISVDMLTSVNVKYHDIVLAELKHDYDLIAGIK